MNLLFGGCHEIQLALCAMRTIGDAQSLKLIDQSVGDKREGMTLLPGGRQEPSFEPVRRKALESIARRQRDG